MEKKYYLINNYKIEMIDDIDVVIMKEETILENVDNVNDNDKIINDKKKIIKMKGKIKKFDEKLYNKYDIPARELMHKKIGEYVKDNPDIYAQDMILEDEKCKYKYLELQVCATWTDNKYPHVVPYVYERKGHFSDDTLFIIFDKNFTKGLLFSKKSLNNEPKRIKKYSRTYIYDVPWHKVLPFEMETFDIEIIRVY